MLPILPIVYMYRADSKLSVKSTLLMPIIYRLTVSAFFVVAYINTADSERSYDIPMMALVSISQSLHKISSKTVMGEQNPRKHQEHLKSKLKDDKVDIVVTGW